MLCKVAIRLCLFTASSTLSAWTRLADSNKGLAAQDVKAKKHDIFRQWCVSFHGVKSRLVLDSILNHSSLMKPGDRLLDGTVLCSTKCAGRQDHGALQVSNRAIL